MSRRASATSWRSRSISGTSTSPRRDDGLRLAGKALELAASLDSHWGLAEAHRIRGELLLARGEAEVALETCFETAIATARQQGARSWELRAAMSMARLWRDQGKRQ